MITVDYLLEKTNIKDLWQGGKQLETQEGKCYYNIVKKKKNFIGLRKKECMLILIRGKAIGYLYEMKADEFQILSMCLKKLPRPKKIVDFGVIKDVLKKSDYQIQIQFKEGAMDVDEWQLVFANTKIRNQWSKLITESRKIYIQSQKKVIEPLKQKKISAENPAQTKRIIIQQSSYRMDQEEPDIEQKVLALSAPSYKSKDVQDQVKQIQIYEREMEALQRQFQQAQLIFQKEKEIQLKDIQNQKLKIKTQKEELQKEREQIRNQISASQKLLQQIKEQNSRLKVQNQDLRQKYIAALQSANEIKINAKKEQAQIQKKAAKAAFDAYLQVEKKFKQKDEQKEMAIQQIKIQYEEKIGKAMTQAHKPIKQNRNQEIIRLTQLTQQQKYQIDQLRKESFFHIFPSIPLHYRRFLYNTLKDLTYRQILHTDLLFKYEKQDQIGFHKRIDGKRNIMLTMLTKTGRWIALYSEGGFSEQGENLQGFGFIAALNQEKVFKKLQNKPSAQYDSQYLTVGASELRIQQLQALLYSNFDLPTGHYYSPPSTVHTLLGANGKREVQLQSYEVHQVNWR